MSTRNGCKKEKDSNLVKALNLVKEGNCDAVLSAGSTGVFLAGSTFIVGRIKGVERPALAPLMPGKNGAFYGNRRWSKCGL